MDMMQKFPTKKNYCVSHSDYGVILNDLAFLLVIQRAPIVLHSVQQLFHLTISMIITMYIDTCREKIELSVTLTL